MLNPACEEPKKTMPGFIASARHHMLLFPYTLVRCAQSSLSGQIDADRVALSPAAVPMNKGQDVTVQKLVDKRFEKSSTIY